LPTIVVIGGQWGDEGKGAVVDRLVGMEKPTKVVRFNGGGNAGHTVKNELGEFRLHHVPSGIFHPELKRTCVLGGGMVIDLAKLQGELFELENPKPAVEVEPRVFKVNKAVSVEDVKISLLAHLVMPWHRLLEAQEEEMRGEARIATTGQGIGPCYSDRAGRRGVQIRDLNHETALKEKLNLLYPYNLGKLREKYRAQLPSQEMILQELLSLAEELKGHFADTEEMLAEAQNKGETIVLEGAQGTLLDVDYGLYPPFVTSSHTTRWGAYLGSGVKPASDDRVIGVFKAYVTRVGEGPFPTEDTGEAAQQLRNRAKDRGSAEVGTTTGRPRKVGWPDIPLARYSQRINGFTEIAFTKTDVLDELEKIKVAVAYRLGRKSLSIPPRDIGDFRNCEPRYSDMPGWCEDTSKKRRVQDLPEEMKAFLRGFETGVGAPIHLIGVGPKREEVIDLGERNLGSIL